MKPVIAYLRINSSEPEASDIALRNQRDDLDHYLKETGSVLVGEFIEEASMRTGQAFVEACYAVARHKATLVVASVQPIGSGMPLKAFSFPVLHEGFTVSTGGPTMEEIEPVILGQHLEAIALGIRDEDAD